MYHKVIRCKASCKVKDNKVILVGEHSHPPEIDKIEHFSIINEVWCNVIHGIKGSRLHDLHDWSY